MALPVQNVLNLTWGLLATRDVPGAKGLEVLGRAQVPAAEIPGEYLEPAGDVELAELLKLSRSKRVRMFSVRLPFGMPGCDISDPDEDHRQMAVSRYRDLIRKAAVINAQVVTFTPSHLKDDLADPDDIISALCHSLDDLLPEAEKFNLRLALKNDLPPYFGHRPEHFETLLGLYGSPWLGCCFDTGHAHLTKTFTWMLEIMWPRLFSLHLHDNLADRDWHLQPGYGTAPFEILFRKLAERPTPWTDPVIIEARPWGVFDGPRLFLEMDALVNSLVGPTDSYPTLNAPAPLFGSAWPADWRERCRVRCPVSGHLVVFHRDKAVTPAREWSLAAPPAVPSEV